MRKTVTITIGGMLFHIEELAYVTLDTYLESIRSHFSSFAEREEIVSDIESRIAEEFTDALKKHKRAAITEGDVEELMKRMGTVEDFAAFDSDKVPPRSEKSNTFKDKKLYRDTENQIIAGVCAGIANYFGIDPLIVRVLFGASLLFGGAGIVIYIVLWIVLPEAKTPIERAEMAGIPLTLRKIEARIKEKIPDAKRRMNDGTFKRVLMFPFVVLRKVLSFIGKALKFVLPILGRILGFVIVLATLGGILFLSFWLIMLLGHSWEQYIDVPIRQMMGDTLYISTLVSGYIVAFVPLALLCAGGVSLLQMKNAFRFGTVITLVSLWIIAVLVGAVTIAQHAPGLERHINDYVESTQTTKDIPIVSFKELRVREGVDVQVEKGQGYKLTVSGAESAVESIAIRQNDGHLDIARRDDFKRFCIICLGHDAKVILTVPGSIGNVEAVAGARLEILPDDVVFTGDTINASAGSVITMHGPIQSKMLDIQVFAGSEVSIANAVNLEAIKIIGHAGSRIEVRGAANTADISLDSGSSMRAPQFTVQEAIVNASSGASAQLHIVKKLSGGASSGADVRYQGNPDTSEFDDGMSGWSERVDEPEAPEWNEEVIQ